MLPVFSGSKNPPRPQRLVKGERAQRVFLGLPLPLWVICFLLGSVAVTNLVLLPMHLGDLNRWSHRKENPQLNLNGDVFDTVDIDALAASATIGCLERPDVGKVIVLGAQPDCINDDLRANTPNRIPKIVHQTYKNLDLPPLLWEFVNTWVQKNPGWEVRHYSDADCAEMVAAEFPEHAEAYHNLAKPVEKADFFRYLVVLRYGGVYADMDTECRVPLDSYLSDSDTLVAGWENEFRYVPEQIKRSYSRQRQLLQWVFAAAPGHPALKAVCGHIQRNSGKKFSLNPNFDTLDRTGPGAWTDAVLGYVMADKAKASNPLKSDWPVRLLPRVAFGAFNLDGVPSNSPGALVLHHFSGSWKKRQWCHKWGKFFLSPWILVRGLMGHGWNFRKPLVYAPHILRPGAVKAHPWESFYIPHVSGFTFSSDFWSWSTKAQHDSCLAQLAELPAVEISDLTTRAGAPYPVSISWWPPFTMMVHQVGVEAVARQDGDDVSAHISAWGMWEAGWSPPIRKGPSSMYALLSILGKPEPALARGMQVGRAAKACRGGETSREGLLIDVGAGIGLFSLAAAASGVQVVAIEPEKDNRQLLEDSVAINGLEERVTVLDDILGSGEGETVCLREGLGLKTMVYMSGSDVGSPQVPNFDAEKRRWMISPDRHTVADLPLEPWKKEGPKGCYAGWKPSVQHRLDNVVKKPLQEALSRRSGLSWTVLRVSTDTASILKGASLLLGGHLLEGMLPPSVVLIEVPALDLMAIPPVITALAAHGYNQTLFHSGSLCRDVPLPSKQQPNPSDIDVPPEIGRLVSPGAKWCRCQDHQLQAVITSHRADSVRGIRAATDSGPNSMSIILLHSSRISTPEGMQWLETMQVGSNGNGCVR